MHRILRIVNRLLKIFRLQEQTKKKGFFYINFPICDWIYSEKAIPFSRLHSPLQGSWPLKFTAARLTGE